MESINDIVNNDKRCLQKKNNTDVKNAECLLVHKVNFSNTIIRNILGQPDLP